MAAAFWRHGSLAALAATLLLVRQAAADPVLRTSAKLSQPGLPADTQLTPPADTQPSLPANTQLTLPMHTQFDVPVNAPFNAPVSAQFNLRATPRLPLQQAGGVLERVPTASWAMGCAAGIALAMHAVYQNSSDRHRTRMKSCADDCPNYRIDHYKEVRERADVALRLSVFAAASALWLVYNDPGEALERMGQRKPPREQPGFRVKVKTERRGVWASVVAYF